MAGFRWCSFCRLKFVLQPAKRVGIVTRLRGAHPRSYGLILGWEKSFLFSLSIQTIRAAHPAFCALGMGGRVLSRELKRPGLEVDQSSLYCANIKNDWS